MPHIRHIQIGSEFAFVEDIVLSIGSGLKSMTAKYGGRVQLLNVPVAAPPDAPRIIVTTENFILNVAPMRYDVLVTVPTQIDHDFQKVIEFTLNLFQRLGGDLAQLRLSYSWIGMIINLQYPSNKETVSSLELVEPVFDRLVNVERGGKKLSALQLQFGFEEHGLNKIFTVSGYDSMSFKFDRLQAQPKILRVDKESADVVESGITISIDVNNRPDKKKLGLIKDFQNIVRESKSVYEQLPETLNLKEILPNE